MLLNLLTIGAVASQELTTRWYFWYDGIQEGLTLPLYISKTMDDCTVNFYDPEGEKTFETLPDTA